MAGNRMAQMRAKEQSLTADRLRELVSYDSETGFFTSRMTVGRCDRWKAGRRIGWQMSHGYRSILIDNEEFLEHRAAWLYMIGEWPEGEVDHRNLIRSDNAWINLRLADHHENCRNHPGHHKAGSGRLKGTTQHPNGRWVAQIMVDYRRIYLGIYSTQELAHAAYCEASERLHGEFGRVSV